MWQFPADLHLIDWLDELDFEYDIITDHDLAAEGADLLKSYNAVITGTHPEYCSGGMLDAWEEFLATGGRGMYLAGNGFYWITSQHPDKPWMIKVRKGEQGDQAWRARPGELFHSTTGERGGLWRMRARAPQKLFGTGFIAHGLDRSTGYYQLPDARDQRTSWITDGIDDSEIIGDFGLVNGGASGLEVDCVDYALGTPPTRSCWPARGALAQRAVGPGGADVRPRRVQRRGGTRPSGQTSSTSPPRPAEPCSRRARWPGAAACPTTTTTTTFPP